MQSSHSIRYVIASSHQDSYSNAVPLVPLGPIEEAEYLAIIGKDTYFTMFPLYPGCKSGGFALDALWVVLEVTECKFDPENGSLAFDKALVVYRGVPRDVCAWLTTNSHPVPADGVEVAKGVNFEHIKVQYGTVIGAHHGIAEVGTIGVAHAGICGQAIAGNHAVAVSFGSEAKAADNSVAVELGRGHVVAGKSSIAVNLDEFHTATTGERGVSKVGFGGTAITGPEGVAIARTGTIQGGPGAVLILHNDELMNVLRVGENGILADTPYHYSYKHGKVVEGEWSFDALPG